VKDISGEEHYGVVIGVDHMDVSTTIVESEDAPLELPGLHMKVIDTGETALPVGTSGMRIAVLTEEEPSLYA
jgi:hypothetical protein